MRGYGLSSAPVDVSAYDVLTLCGDVRAAMDHFGHRQVALIGHDWGAMVAWYLALLEQERVTALVPLSVPFAGSPRRPDRQSVVQGKRGSGRVDYGGSRILKKKKRNCNQSSIVI